MVLWCGLVVPSVLEAGGVGVRQVERHVGVAVINSIQFLAVHELEQVVLHNWNLSVHSMLSSRRLSLDAVTESEDVVKARVLQSVWVHVNHASRVSDSGFN